MPDEPVSYQNKVLKVNKEYHIPTYTKLLVKNFSVDALASKVDLTFTFLVWIKCGDAPKWLENFFMENGIKYRFHNGEERSIDKTNSNMRSSKG